MDNSNCSGSNYTKFTVPQLKARCKELGITGYSKLGKAALLEKLAQYESARNGTGSTRSKATDSPNECLPAVQPNPEPQTAAQVVPSVVNDTLPVAPRQNGEEFPAENIGRRMATDSPGILPHAGQKKEKPKSTKKRACDSVRVAPSAAAKRQKASGKGNAINGAENVPPVEQPIGKASKTTTLRQGSTAPVLSSQRLLPVIVATDLTSTCNPLPLRPPSSLPTSKPFRPLTPCRKSFSKPAQLAAPPAHTPSLEQLVYLDFSFAPSSTPLDSFSPITIPPTLSQRKHVNARSVILSGLSDDERRRCALVSRTIRYAVYLSAVPIITRVFGQRRFTELPQKYNMSMTNFWPYLKELRAELEAKHKMYISSFLPRFFGNHIPISEQIWACPENEKQLTVALRFLMTRVWFAISVSRADENRTRGTIVTEVREVVKDEIWRITVVTKATREQEMFYVLEPTCEVIGLPPTPRPRRSFSSAESSSETSETVYRGRPYLRVDWSEYVECRISEGKGSDRQPSLLSHLKSTNAEEYMNGISKLWLTRMVKEGEIGEYKRRIAGRYTLACVVGNSVSGRWMSSTHMAQVFAGTASESDADWPSLLHKREKQRMNLFLPAHHLVESVHFSTAGPKAQNLHPALAIVQTPGREYFILRDNGMEVGCEEDGVWPVWMELLGCDAQGVTCT